MNINKKDLTSQGTVYKPSSPFNAKVISNEHLTSEGSPDDIRHIVLDIQGSGIQYMEGQSIGIIPPGTDESGKRHRVRLYSIASARTGESSRDTVALTVKRVIFTDEETGNLVKGLASNYVCDLKEGDEVLMTGPIGRTFILPDDESTDLIMVAVGTGIAPFRAFLNYIYKEHKSWKGKVLLFFGSKTGFEALYMNDKNNDIGQYYDEKTFIAFQALSREGDKKYVQQDIMDNKDLLWSIIKKNNFCFYVCGLKGIEEGIEEIFQSLAEKENLDWAELKKQFKENHQWHVEVY